MKECNTAFVCCGADQSGSRGQSVLQGGLR